MYKNRRRSYDSIIIISFIGLIGIFTILLLEPTPPIKNPVLDSQKKLKKVNPMDTMDEALSTYLKVVEQAQSNDGTISTKANEFRKQILEDWFFVHLRDPNEKELELFQKIVLDFPEIINEYRKTIKVAKHDFFVFPLYLDESLVILCFDDIKCANENNADELGQNTIIHIQ